MTCGECPGFQILVVDDSATSRTWTRLRLQRAGYTVHEAERADEAFALIGQQPPDLILLDVILPDMDGFEVTRRLRQDEKLATIPVVLVTALGDAESKVRALEAGANDFLAKPPGEAELLVRVRTLLRLKQNQEELVSAKNRSELLYRISRELSGELELDALLSSILALTAESLRASRGSIILLDKSGAARRNIFSRQGEGVMITEHVWERVVQEGLAGWVIEQKRGTIVSNVAGDERWLVGDQAHGRVQSAVAVPLIQEGRVVGVLTLTDENADHFTGDDLDLLASIGSQAAVAIEKAQLFEAVEQERGRLEAILTGTTDAIVATDEARRVTLINPAAERAFGVKFADVEGKVLREALPVRELVEAFEQTGENSEPEWAELTLPDGRTLFLNVSAIAGSRGEGGWVAVMQDITYLKELDRMKNEFVSTVSHDLRSPLATIRGYAELLHRRVEGEERDYLECIKTNAEQMGELVGDLLDLGRIEAGVAEARIPCRIEEIIEEAVRGVSLRAEMKQLTLTRSLPSALKPVIVHPVQLRQVLDNLLSNAIKYTPDGGAVSVRAQERDGGVAVEVQDNGIGIPEEAVPRLFGKFFRVKNLETQPVPGTGLGLAIVKAIVEHHEGHVWVTTTLGEGSTFGFWLPGCGDGPPTEGSVEEK